MSACLCKKIRKNRTKREEVEKMIEMGKLKNMKQKRSKMNDNILKKIKKNQRAVAHAEPM